MVMIFIIVYFVVLMACDCIEFTICYGCLGDTIEIFGTEIWTDAFVEGITELGDECLAEEK